MEWESDSSCLSHTYSRQGWGSPGRCSSLELEFGEYGATPGWGLLLTVERWIEGRWGRRLWWELPVEESWAAMEARWYCWVMCSGWSHWFLHATEICVVLYIPFHWSGTPVYSQLMFCMYFCVWRCIPDVSMERDVLHIHLLLCHLVLLLFSLLTIQFTQKTWKWIFKGIKYLYSYTSFWWYFYE